MTFWSLNGLLELVACPGRSKDWASSLSQLQYVNET